MPLFTPFLPFPVQLNSLISTHHTRHEPTRPSLPFPLVRARFIFRSRTYPASYFRAHPVGTLAPSKIHTWLQRRRKRPSSHRHRNQINRNRTPLTSAQVAWGTHAPAPRMSPCASVSLARGPLPAVKAAPIPARGIDTSQSHHSHPVGPHRHSRVPQVFC
jgi:hypothetical protein